MAWRRGFVRIWIVLTVIWVVGACLWLYPFYFGDSPPRFTEDYRVTDIAPFAVPIDPRDADPIGGSGTMRTEKVKLRDIEGTLYYRDGISAVAVERALAGMRDQLDGYQKPYDLGRSDSLPWAFGLVFAPPLILAGLGVVLGWIVRGFRREQN